MNRLTIEEKKRANKIRCKLLYTIDKDIRETKKKNQESFMINSMTLKEIEDKFLLFQNYKMKLSTTFTKIANKYMVMKTVDNRLHQNFFYTDYLQDLKKVNHSIVKLERKRISASDIIKIKIPVDNQEIQSPLPEFLTNKMNIGDKKLIQPSNKDSDINKKFSSNGEDNNKEIHNNNIKNIGKEKNKKLKHSNDDDSINSLTYELIQKKAKMLSESINTKNKKELRRRKNQLEAIRNLRQFCFQKLRNKRRCIAKSSHQNLIYINTKFEEEEEEKNNSSISSSYNYKSGHKNKINNTKVSKNKIGKNNSKKKYDGTSETKKKRNTKKIKEKKKIENSSVRKPIRQFSAKKSPPKIKRTQNERKSLVINNNLISGKLEKDILRFKKQKKNKNEKNERVPTHPTNAGDEDIFAIIQYKLRKKKTGILRESYKDKNNNKYQLIFNKQKVKAKYNMVIFNEANNATKRNSSENNFFNRRHKTKNNINSTRNLIKPVKIFKFNAKSSECKSDRNRRYSTPNKSGKKNKKDISGKSVYKLSFKKTLNLDLLKSNNKNDKKGKNSNKFKQRKTFAYIGKSKPHKEMQKVDEEEY